MGEAAPQTVVKAIRLPVHLLERLQAKAEAQGLSLNALLQMAASEYLSHHRGA
jgi:predicted DNA binding CopG/RHH family protein